MHFGQIRQEKIVSLLFWIKKSFLDQKKKLSKKSKNSKFSKRVSPWFLSKNRTFCHLCLVGKSTQKRSFFRSLVPSRPRQFRMGRHLSSLSGKFALGSKPPLVTRIANRPGDKAGFLVYWIKNNAF